MKNAILKTITSVMVMVLIICTCCIDSANDTPFVIGMVVAYAWIGLFAKANGFFG